MTMDPYTSVMVEHKFVEMDKLDETLKEIEEIGDREKQKENSKFLDRRENRGNVK